MQQDFRIVDNTAESTKAGYPAVFQTAIEQAQARSRYFLLFGKQSDPTGIYTKFWVEVRLPKIGDGSCSDSLLMIVSNSAKTQINLEYERLGHMPMSYDQAEIMVMRSLGEIFKKGNSCCAAINSNLSQCIICDNPDNIKNYLNSAGLTVRIPIYNIGNHPSGTSTTVYGVENYAGLLFTVNDLLGIDIAENYRIAVDSFRKSGVRFKIFITKDENICTAKWKELMTVAQSGQYDIVFWHHIHKGKGIDDQYLFSGAFFKKSGGANKNNQAEKFGPDPFSFVLGFLGSAATDVLLQTAIHYLVDDDIKKDDYNTAFERVNYGSVVVSGILGGFGVDLKAYTAIGSASIALGTVAYSAATNPNYSKEQGLKDFSIIFATSYLSVKAGAAISAKFQSLGINNLSFNGFKKLSGWFRVGNTIATKEEIRLAWLLSADGQASIFLPIQRGITIQEWVFDGFYRTLGFRNMGELSEYFPYIDFYHAAQRMGLSVKSTNATTYEGLEKLLEKNIRDLIEARRIGRIIFNGETFGIDRVRLVVIVPEENQAALQPIMNQLMNDLDPFRRIDNFEIRTVENLLGL